MLKKAVIFTALLCFGIGNLCFADSSRMLDKILNFIRRGGV